MGAYLTTSRLALVLIPELKLGLILVTGKNTLSPDLSGPMVILIVYVSHVSGAVITGSAS